MFVYKVRIYRVQNSCVVGVYTQYYPLYLSLPPSPLPPTPQPPLSLPPSLPLSLLLPSPPCFLIVQISCVGGRYSQYLYYYPSLSLSLFSPSSLPTPSLTPSPSPFPISPSPSPFPPSPFPLPPLLPPLFLYLSHTHCLCFLVSIYMLVNLSVYRVKLIHGTNLSLPPTSHVSLYLRFLITVQIGYVGQIYGKN